VGEHQLTSDAALRPTGERSALIHEEVPVNRSLDYREDVFVEGLLRVGRDLTHVTDEGHPALERLQLDAVVDIELTLKVVGDSQQRNVVVVLLRHQLGQSLLGL
jgi:hypothetical protein